jgi:F0F1-type ATP synthase assembly protein I
MPSPSPKDQSALRRAGMLLAIPGILIVSPLVGLFVGMAVDRWLHTGRIFAFVGTMLGFVAGGRETWTIYRRYQKEMEDQDAGR